MARPSSASCSTTPPVAKAVAVSRRRLSKSDVLFPSMQSKLAAAKPRDKLCHFHHVGHITKHASNQKTVSDQKNCICRRIRKTPSPAFASQSLKWALLPLKYFHFPAGGHLRRETREWLHWHNIRAQ